MQTTTAPPAPDHFGEAMRRLTEVCAYTGAEAGFWGRLLQVMSRLVGARADAALRAVPAEAGTWELLHSSYGSDLEELAEHYLAVARKIGPGDFACDEKGLTITVRVFQEEGAVPVMLVFFFPGVRDKMALETQRRLSLFAPVPLLYQLRQQVTHSETAVGHFAAVLDLVANLNAHRHFLSVAMALCNEVATRHQCNRVSLGWLEHGYAKVMAISQSERFDRKMEAIQSLERVMEEALDQDEIVVWPESEGSHSVTRAHGEFAVSAKAPYLCSVPLRLEGEPLAVLVCERSDHGFADVEQRLLALYGEVAIRRLADLRRTDRWFGARWWLEGREQFARLAGPRHALAKLLGLVAVVGLPVLALWQVDYRVDAPFALRTEDVAYLSAPFNGFIDEVKVTVGDEVAKDAVLVTLDTRDLLLEEAGAAAERQRYLGEVEKASGADKPSDMRIAQAQADQAQVRLQLVQYRRGQANIAAPFGGVVVEGDLKKRIGAPVKQGEVLVRLARTDGMYIECDVNERDLRELKVGGTGEIAFASAPKLKFKVHTSRLEPLAQPKETGNIFLVRAAIEGQPEKWWRPGMSGVAKLDVARRSLLWVLLHRTVEFFRMQFWW